MIDLNTATQMRREGATYAEIGERFGVTRQCASQFLNRKGKPRKNAGMISRIPYKGLYEFMASNYKMTIPKLTLAIMGVPDRAAQAKVYRLLEGSDAALPKRAYDGLIALTGMSYEELFAKREDIA